MHLKAHGRQKDTVSLFQFMNLSDGLECLQAVTGWVCYLAARY